MPVRNVSTSPASSPARRRAALALASVLLIGGIGLGVFSLRSRTQAQDRPLDPMAARNKALNELRDKNDPFVIAHMQTMRDHWRVWAMAHKDILRAMLHAQHDDIAALKAVSDALPEVGTLVLHPEQTGITKDDLNSPAGTYTWCKVTDVYHQTPDGFEKDPEATQASAASFDKLQKEDFEMFRDISLSGPTTPESHLFKLYASGRITRIHFVHGQRPEIEIAPIYDELR